MEIVHDNVSQFIEEAACDTHIRAYDIYLVVFDLWNTHCTQSIWNCTALIICFLFNKFTPNTVHVPSHPKSPTLRSCTFMHCK